MCIVLARKHSAGSLTSPTTVENESGFTNDPADDTPTRVSDAEFEAKSYYFGFPSRPVSVYRTGTPWERPIGPYHVPKEARPVFDHPIADAWDELGPQVPDYLDSMNVTWTTIDVVRFTEDEKEPGPPVLWIGVKPGSLSREHAKATVVGCESH